MTQQPSKRSAKIQEMVSRLEQETDLRTKIDLFNDLAASVSSTDPERAREYALEAMERSRSLSYERGIAFSLQSMAQVHFCVSEYERALQKGGEALTRFMDLGLIQEAARTHLILASVHLRQSKQGQGMEETVKAIELSESCGDLQGVAIGKNLLGILYGDQGQDDLALEHLQASAEIHKQIGDHYRFAMAQINLGNLHSRKGEMASAASCYELAAEMLEEIEPDGYPIATLYFDLGEMWRDQGEKARSEGFHRKALALRRRQGNETGVAASLNGIGRLYSSRGEIEKAREAFEEALSICQRVGIPKEKWLSGVGLAETEEAAGNYLLALRRQKEAVKYHEEYLDALQQDRIARIKAEFESESKEREAKLYQLENVRLKDEVKRRKKAEAALVQVQKLESLGLMAGGMAHDFNNLLHCVQGYHELAMSSLPEGHEALQNLGMANAAAQRACNLAEQMLTYSGGRKYEFKSCDLKDWFETNLEFLQAAVGKQTEIFWEKPDRDSPLVILADEDQFFQMMMNLAVNGKEAGASRLVFELTRRDLGEDKGPFEEFTGEPLKEGAYVLVRVQDNGVGMEGDLVQRIFDPFFSTKFTGRGLGLAAVLGIIRGHQGGVRVQSQPSVGTVFELAFPFGKARALSHPQIQSISLSDTGGGKSFPGNKKAASFTAKPRPREGGPSTILVIDDEEAICSLLKAHLESGGFSVLTASDGAEGLEVFRTHSKEIALVLLDLTMPGLSGKETWDGLKELCPEVPIVLSSGYDRERVLAEFSQTVPLLSKPYSGAFLLHFLRSVLGERPSS